MNEKIQVDPRHVLSLVSHVFWSAYAPQRGLSAADAARADVEDFVSFLAEQLAIADAGTLCRSLKVAETAYAFLSDAGAAGALLGVVTGMWWHVVLASRVPAHALKGMTMLMLLRWEDGRVLPYCHHIDRGMTVGPLADGDIASAVLRQARDMQASLVNDGLDGLYDVAADVGEADGVAVAEALYGAIVRHVIPGMKPAFADKARKMAVMFRAVFCPPESPRPGAAAKTVPGGFSG